MFNINMCRPDHLFISVWTFALLGYATAFHLPSLEVLVLVGGFGLAFWFGALGGHLVPYKPAHAAASRPTMLLIGIWALSLLSLYYAFQVGSYILNSGIGFLALAEIRQAALGGEPVIDNGNTLITAVQMNFCLALLGYIYEKFSQGWNSEDAVRAVIARRARRFLTVAVLSLVISLLDGSRSFLLMGAICIVICQLILGVYRVRRAVLFFAAFVTVFSVTFPIVRPEVESAFDGFRYTMVYFAGGVGSLDYALTGRARVYWQDFEAIANKLGSLVPGLGGYDLSALRMEMVNIGNDLQTNVYTALGVYYEYFGLTLTLIFALFAGAALAWLGRRARYGPAYLFVYVFYAAATVLSLFHEYYLSTSYLLLKVAAVVACMRLAEWPLHLAHIIFRRAVSAQPRV